MNPWQTKQLAATYADEERRRAAARALASPGRRPLRRAGATVLGELLVQVGQRLVERGSAFQAVPAPRRADAC